MTSSILRHLGVIALAGICLTACQTLSGQPQYQFYSAAQLDERLVEFDKAKIDDCLKSTGGDATVCRDRIVNSQLEVIDFAYRSFTQAISQTSGSVDITGDILAAALSGASTVASVSRAKTVLSGIATVITGGKASIDKNLFLQQAAHVMIGRMDALRAKALGVIRTSQLKPAEQYSLWQALRDVQAYIEAGSFGAAITDIEKNSGAVKTETQDTTQQIIESYGPDDNTKLLRDFLLQDGKVNPDDQKQIREEMKKANVSDDVSITVFIYAAKYAAARATAVKDLNLKH
jgi:hypothetical protein